jgi:hypothetical protein
MNRIFPAAIMVGLLNTAVPALAASAPPVALTTCAKPLGSVAVVDGDTQGWAQWGLGSPRPLLAALASQSGCFTVAQAGGAPANFLINAIAGSKEEVNQGVAMARNLAVEGLVRSGAAGQVLGKVPMGGALLGAFGGFGGKKKIVAAGLRVISPANGATLVAGSGEVTKSSLQLGGAGALMQGVAAAGYGGSKDGQMLTEAFIIAFNAVVAQGAALQSAMATPVASVQRAGSALAAVDTEMMATPAKTGEALRAVRAGTTLRPTGNRQGNFVEVADDFGTKGWVAVEDLK